MFSKGAWIGLKSIFRRNQFESDLDEEMQFHLEMQTKQNIERGMSPRKARLEALRAFGGEEKFKEICRESWGMRIVLDFWRDIAFGFRQLRKDKGFAFVSIATLAIGIGACSAMFSVVNTVLLEELPFEEPERLAWAQSHYTTGLSSQTMRVDNYLEWRDENDSFESMGAYFAFFEYSSYFLEDGGGNLVDRLNGVPITEGFLETLGVQPFLGRGFEANELVWNGPQVVILNHDTWKRHFGSDASVIGTSVTISGEPRTIVGVMPPSFDFDAVFTPGTKVDMLMPFPLVEETNRFGNTLSIVGRLKGGVTVDEAETNLKLITDRIKERVGERDGRYHHAANVSKLDDRVRGPYRSAFWILSGAVVCVLIIACVNIANLLIARSNGRRKEFAMRAAIGAKRWQLFRQTLVESLILSFGGLAFGLLLAVLGTNWISSLEAFSIPLVQNVSVDGTSIVFVVLISCLAGIVCGILPAIQFSGTAPMEALGDDGQRGTSGKRSAWLRKGLVVIEVALSCLLLIAAGLLIRSVESLLDEELGFEPSNAFVWHLDGAKAFDSWQERSIFYSDLADAIEALPGVDRAGLTDTLPLGRNRQWGVRAKVGENGQEPRGSGVFPRVVDDGYADAMGIKLVAGRFFNAFDTEDSQMGFVINEKLAKRLWDGQDPIGKAIVTGRREGIVIGVVEDVRHSSLDEKPSPEMYLYLKQLGDGTPNELVVRSKMPPELLVARVREGLRSYDKRIPIDDFVQLQSLIDKSVAPQRLIKNVLSAFSFVALILATIGLYGVISYTIGQRTREIGIRLAIGAHPSEIVKMIVRDGLGMTVLGTVIGLAGAYGLSRYMSSLLYQVSATDPMIFASNAVVVAAIAMVASFLPARKASKADPTQALRVD